MLSDDSEEMADFADRQNENDLEHRELLALRKAFFKAPEEEIKNSIPLQDMKEYIRQKSVCLIGGHDNWIKK